MRQNKQVVSSVHLFSLKKKQKQENPIFCVGVGGGGKEFATRELPLPELSVSLFPSTTSQVGRIPQRPQSNVISLSFHLSLVSKLKNEKLLKGEYKVLVKEVCVEICLSET